MTMRMKAMPLKIKALNDDGTFTGYGSVFDVKDAYGDVVQKGAFAGTLKSWGEKQKLPPMLWQHKHSEPIGVYEKMTEDEHGLLVEGRLLIDDDVLAKRAYGHLKAGSISGLSIGYTIPKGGGEWDDKEGIFRLKNVNLWEVSLVTFPANEAAQIDSVKSALTSERDFERFLREAGLSRMQAKTVISKGYRGLNQREADEQTALKLKQLLSKFN